MKKFKAILLSLLLIVNVFALSACDKKDKDPSISKVSAENLNKLYYVEDNPDFEDVNIKITYSDDTIKTLTKGEIDLPNDTDPQSDTEFVLYTDGLYAQTEKGGGNGVTLGDYDFEVLIIETNKKYSLGTVYVNTEASKNYDLTLYSIPKNFSKFKEKATEQGTAEANFKVHDDQVLTVGDDNSFSIKPQFTLMPKTLDESDIINQDNGELVLDVTVKNGGVEVGEEIYTYENGKIDFTESAIGNTYTITVVPHDFKTNKANTYDITVKVENGYNIEYAFELGLLNMVDDKGTADWYASYDASLQIFYDSQSGKHISKNYYDVWRPYLQEKFAEKNLDQTLIKQVNNVFILNDINVGTEDVPAEYLVSQEESEYAAGFARDWSFLYQHFMTNNFNMNGNYFTISFEKYPVARTNQTFSGEAEVQKQKPEKAEIGHSGVFAFVGEATKVNPYKATIKNLDTIGNTNTDNIPQDDDQNSLGKGMIFMRAIASSVNMDNLIIKEHLIAYFPEAYDNQENEAQITNTKIYDSFSDAIYNYGATYGGVLSHCEIKRCGGPAILLIGVKALNTETGETDANESPIYKHTGLTLSEDTVVESFVNCTEPWFSITGASGLAPMLDTINNSFSMFAGTGPNATILKDGKINCICVAIDENYLTTTNPDLYVNLHYAGNETFSTTNKTLVDYTKSSWTQYTGMRATYNKTYLELLKQQGTGLMGLLVQIYQK